MALPTSEAPSTASSARALIRRLRTSSASLLPPTLRPGARRRTVADFHLQLDDPHRVYSPSDIVTGYAIVALERPLALTHLTVSLVGCVSVCTPAPREPGRRSKRGNREGWGNAAAPHLQGRRPAATSSGAAAAGFGTFHTCWDEAVLCGTGRLEPKPYRFPFQLEFRRLPGIAGLPTSLDVPLPCPCLSPPRPRPRPRPPSPSPSASALALALAATHD